MTAGIFGGSFNPVHNGHIALAKALLERDEADSIWFTLSPLNPLKAHPEELVADSHRLEMLRLATKDIAGVEVCDIELTLPRPSFTVNTMKALEERFPDIDFRLVIGSDNMLMFDRWKDHDLLRRLYSPIVYPRPGYPCKEALQGLPVFPVSSTEIRRLIKEHKPLNNLLPEEVIEYISSHRLYAEQTNA